MGQVKLENSRIGYIPEGLRADRRKDHQGRGKGSESGRRTGKDQSLLRDDHRMVQVSLREDHLRLQQHRRIRDPSDPTADEAKALA